MKIIVYATGLIRIGGVETFVYNWCKNLAPYYDIMVLYNEIHPDQLSRLQKICVCEKNDKNKRYECDLVLYSTAWGISPDNIFAKKYWQMIHANYEEMQIRMPDFKYIQYPRTQKHIAVSQIVANAFKRLYGIDCKVMYNMLDEEPMLRLVTASRLSKEKGYERMKKMAKMLKDAGIKFEWRIYTDLNLYSTVKVDLMPYPEIKYLEPTYNVRDIMRWADYVVQLSDTEGNCLSVNEALFYGVPVITTDYDSARECVTDGVNGFILNMDLSNFDIKKVMEKPYQLKYTPHTTTKDWIKLIGKPSKTGFYENEVKTVNVKVVRNYFDKVLNMPKSAGDKMTITLKRLTELESIMHNGVKIKVVEVINK